MKAPAGRSVTLRVREYKGSKVARVKTASVTGTGTWQQVSVWSAPTDGGSSISLDVLVSLASNHRAQVDDVSLRRI